MTTLQAGLIFLSTVFGGMMFFLAYLVKKNIDRDIAEINRDKRIEELENELKSLKS